MVSMKTFIRRQPHIQPREVRLLSFAGPDQGVFLPGILFSFGLPQWKPVWTCFSKLHS
ncbi:MAG: hypothetical protein AVDCRST_MAG56-7780 [uncultured Cytophagales bacterium]|uniref:Uncharacterized protein n=1 Tax=uncultured Cytophagales bacterium TaxID=158755 RepID=A0A6J4LR17_9SPHI|nr:MAG: hypothetical protein AVDCRST_MAG56-7780 [uncultured Cytophagales bacterium]